MGCKDLIQNFQNCSKRKSKEKNNNKKARSQKPSGESQTLSQTVLGKTECITFLNCNLAICIK